MNYKLILFLLLISIGCHDKGVHRNPLIGKWVLTQSRMSNASVFPLDTNNFLKDIVGLYDSISQKTSFTFIDGDRLLINKDDKMKYEGNWDLKNDGILNIMIQDDSLKFRINRITSDSLKIFSEGHNSLRNVDLIFEKKK